MQIECKAGRETVKAETGAPTKVGGIEEVQEEKKS